MLSALGRRVRFSGETLSELFHSGFNLTAVIDQIYRVGVHSILTTLVTGLFVGAIIAIQIYLQVRDFGAQIFLGGLSASVTIRNVGPVLIAFILSGKVGAYTAAELGTMQVTDQLNAIRCLGINPIRYLIVPRVIAVTLSSFLLLVIGMMCAIGGGIFISMVQLGVDPARYIHEMPQIVTATSVMLGLLKSFCFGVLISLIACFHGYYAEGGSAGVGRTVRSAAVECLVVIIGIDSLLSFLFSSVFA